jgi:hypothetical protein
MLDGVIARRLVGGVKTGSRITMLLKHAENERNGLTSKDTLYKGALLGKLNKEVADLQDRVALLVLLKHRAIFGHSVC